MIFKDKIPCCYFPAKVIIIDDNKNFCSNLSLAFGSDFHCHCFASPQEALTYLQEYNASSKSLFTKHILAPSDQTTPTMLSVNIDIAAMCKEIYSQNNRFDRPNILIVDYSMPEMNGLEFCEQLVDLPYQKIILTGEATNNFAVDAFNRGKIERFVKKGESNYLEKLKKYIKELNISYFNQLSQSVFDMLNTSGQNLLRNSKFIEIFNRIISENNIIEFYLTDDTGSYLLQDEEGNHIELIVRTDEDMQSFAELAEDDGKNAIATVIAQRKKMPRMLVWQDRISPVEDWALYDMNLLHVGDNTYYYAIINDNASVSNLTQQKPISYHQYLVENAH